MVDMVALQSAFESWKLVINGITIILMIVAIWDLVWKAIAMWKSARNNQLVWFIFIIIINSAGILPIIYLLFFSKKKEIQKSMKQKRR